MKDSDCPKRCGGRRYPGAVRHWYQEQSGDRLAKRWESAVTSAVMRVVETPGAGALCNFKPAQLHDVRHVSLVGFPKHLLFYEFKGKEILVLRVLHGARDLESLL